VRTAKKRKNKSLISEAKAPFAPKQTSLTLSYNSKEISTGRASWCDFSVTSSFVPVVTARCESQIAGMIPVTWQGLDFFFFFFRYQNVGSTRFYSTRRVTMKAA
jgi:hypothetical protein